MQLIGYAILLRLLNKKQHITYGKRKDLIYEKSVALAGRKSGGVPACRISDRHDTDHGHSGTFPLRTWAIPFLLVLNCFLLIVGMVMDTTPAILILTPILLPIIEAIGMDPIQFGVNFWPDRDDRSKQHRNPFALRRDTQWDTIRSTAGLCIDSERDRCGYLYFVYKESGRCRVNEFHCLPVVFRLIHLSPFLLHCYSQKPPEYHHFAHVSLWYPEVLFCFFMILNLFCSNCCKAHLKRGNAYLLLLQFMDIIIY